MNNERSFAYLGPKDPKQPGSATHLIRPADDPGDVLRWPLAGSGRGLFPHHQRGLYRTRSSAARGVLYLAVDRGGETRPPRINSLCEWAQTRWDLSTPMCSRFPTMVNSPFTEEAAPAEQGCCSVQVSPLVLPQVPQTGVYSPPIAAKNSMIRCVSSENAHLSVTLPSAM